MASGGNDAIGADTVATGLAPGGANEVLPLFPLGVVVFPGSLLPLRIFEPRYQQMLKDLGAIDAQGQPVSDPATVGKFALHLIRFGSEVGEFASPFRVGTVVRIIEVSAPKEGAVLVLVRGEYLVALEKIRDEQAPYLIGEVRRLPELPLGDSPEALEQLAKRVRELALRYRGHAQKALAHAGLRANLPSAATLEEGDPRVLSYRVGELLLVAMPAKQSLLDVPSVAHRLLKERELLEPQLERWEAVRTEGPELPWDRDGDRKGRPGGGKGENEEGENTPPEDMIDETDPDYDYSGFNPFSEDED